MTSRRPFHILESALVCLLLSACGDGIITPAGTPPARLYDVRADASGALAADVDGPLQAALSWRIYSEELIACLSEIEVSGALDLANEADYALALRLDDCFVYSDLGGRAASSVAIESEFPASFSIPIDTLPDPSLLSGDGSARIGLADLILYTDDNTSDAFEETPRGADAFVDRVHGTSRPVQSEDGSLVRAASFVVYREGAVSPLWTVFRAIYGCPEPAPGFSTLTITVSEDQTSATCTLDDRALPVTLSPLASTIACAADPQEYVPQRAALESGLPAGTVATCDLERFDPALVVTVDPESVCPSTREYTLAGCNDFTSAEACEATAWDDSAAPPAWWPCKDGYSGFSAFVVDPRFATDEPADVLFDYLWYNGLGQLTLTDLSVELSQVDANGDTSSVVIGPGGLELMDADGNGVWNAGDRLRVREIGNPFTTTTPGYFTVVVRNGVEVLNLFNPGTYVPVEVVAVPAISVFAADAPAPVTDGIDDLCTVVHLGFDFDPYTYAFDELRAEVRVPGMEPILLAAGSGILFDEDVDGDGRFDNGDRILLRDPTAALDGSVHPALLSEDNVVEVRLVIDLEGAPGAVIATTSVALE